MPSPARAITTAPETTLTEDGQTQARENLGLSYASKSEAQTGSAANRVISPLSLRQAMAASNTANLSADLSLFADNASKQFLTALSANRAVTLPVISATPSSTEVLPGRHFIIANTGSTFSLVITNSSAVELATLAPGDIVTVFAKSDLTWITIHEHAMQSHIVSTFVDLTNAANQQLFTPSRDAMLVAAWVRIADVDTLTSGTAALSIGAGVLSHSGVALPTVGDFDAFAAASTNSVIAAGTAVSLSSAGAAVATTYIAEILIHVIYL